MFAFRKTQRLLKKIEYDRVFAEANKIVLPEYIIFFRKNDFGYARLGITVPKKIIAKAHDRNRIKRLLRESFRQAQLPSVDMVFLARHGLAEQTNLGIYTKLGKTWGKLSSC